MTEEKTGSEHTRSGGPTKYLQQTEVIRKNLPSGWELISTNGSRRESYSVIVDRVNTEEISPLTLALSEPIVTTLSIPSEVDLLSFFAEFMGNAFGFTRDTEDEYWQMFTPLVRCLLATRASLALTAIGQTGIPTPLDAEVSSLPLNQRD